MPRYKVIKPGFYDSKLYAPEGQRCELVTVEAFKKCPSWLKPIEEESKIQRKQRIVNQSKHEKKNAAKILEDKKDIDSATFVQSPLSSQVVTL